MLWFSNQPPLLQVHCLKNDIDSKGLFLFSMWTATNTTTQTQSGVAKTPALPFLLKQNICALPTSTIRMVLVRTLCFICCRFFVVRLFFDWNMFDNEEPFDSFHAVWVMKSAAICGVHEMAPKPSRGRHNQHLLNSWHVTPLVPRLFQESKHYCAKH